MSPLATLGRGFAVVSRVADGALLRDAAQVPVGKEIEARLAKGRLRAQVVSRSRMKMTNYLARLGLRSPCVRAPAFGAGAFIAPRVAAVPGGVVTFKLPGRADQLPTVAFNGRPVMVVRRATRGSPSSASASPSSPANITSTCSSPAAANNNCRSR